MISINNIIRHAARYILNKRKYDSVKNEICNNLEWFFMKHKMMYENICFAFKLAYLSPTHNFRNYLNFSYVESQSTRSKSYKIPDIATNSSWGKKSFKYQAVYDWLQILEPITTNNKSFNVFKKVLTSHLLSLQLNDYQDNLNDNNIDYSSIIDNVLNNLFV